MAAIEGEKSSPTMQLEFDSAEKKRELMGVQEQFVDEDEEYSIAEQRKIIHKVDRRLLIILGLMQAVSFLDRANLSNAAVAGMTKDLQLKIGNRYVSLSTPFHKPDAHTP